MEMSSAPAGIRILLTRKSALSKILFPKNVISDNTLKERADGMPTKKINSPVSQAIFVLLFPFLLVSAATTISSIENADVNVANRNKAKKNSKNNLPKMIWSKTDGKTIKSSPGPAVGSNPKENTAGKIASPARREMKRFMITTEKAG